MLSVSALNILSVSALTYWVSLLLTDWVFLLNIFCVHSHFPSMFLIHACLLHTGSGRSTIARGSAGRPKERYSEWIIVTIAIIITIVIRVIIVVTSLISCITKSCHQYVQRQQSCRVQEHMLSGEHTILPRHHSCSSSFLFSFFICMPPFLLLFRLLMAMLSAVFACSALSLNHPMTSLLWCLSILQATCWRSLWITNSPFFWSSISQVIHNANLFVRWQ